MRTRARLDSVQDVAREEEQLPGPRLQAEVGAHGALDRAADPECSRRLLFHHRHLCGSSRPISGVPSVHIWNGKHSVICETRHAFGVRTCK